jgi:hypothetical protein
MGIIAGSLLTISGVMFLEGVSEIDLSTKILGWTSF